MEKRVGRGRRDWACFGAGGSTAGDGAAKSVDMEILGLLPRPGRGLWGISYVHEASGSRFRRCNGSESLALNGGRVSRKGGVDVEVLFAAFESEGRGEMGRRFWSWGVVFDSEEDERVGGGGEIVAEGGRGEEVGGGLAEIEVEGEFGELGVVEIGGGWAEVGVEVGGEEFEVVGDQGREPEGEGEGHGDGDGEGEEYEGAVEALVAIGEEREEGGEEEE